MINLLVYTGMAGVVGLIVAGGRFKKRLPAWRPIGLVGLALVGFSLGVYAGGVR